jgi:hypothetical protein
VIPYAQLSRICIRDSQQSCFLLQKSRHGTVAQCAENAAQRGKMFSRASDNYPAQYGLSWFAAKNFGLFGIKVNRALSVWALP